MINKIDFKETLSISWKITLQNLLTFTIIVSAMFLFYSGQSFVLEQAKGNIAYLIAVTALAFILNITVNIWLIKVSLMIYDKKKFNKDEVLDSTNILLKYLAGWLLYTLLVLAGLVLLVIPGVIWAVRYMFYQYLFFLPDILQ